MAIKPVSVTKINQYIQAMFDTDSILRNITIEGEISNYKLHQTGIYLGLKDENSYIDCYIGREHINFLEKILENGIKIVATGSVKVFPKRGKYTFNITKVEVEGKGALELAFEKIKSKLEDEGLFDYKHKKVLPSFPNNIVKKIALVTSNTGAVVEDMLRIIKQKNNFVDILIVPVLVQGEKAAQDIAKAIKLLNSDFLDEVDVMILARGGGSREDLWAFNEEIVARAIFESEIPIISAVGHEVDFSISDFVADKRAATPTEAADLAVDSTKEIMEYIRNLRKNIDDSLKNIIRDIDREIFLLKEKLRLLNPQNAIKRGYAAIIDENRLLVNSISNVEKKQTLTIVMSDGELDVEIKKIRKHHE